MDRPKTKLSPVPGGLRGIALVGLAVTFLCTAASAEATVTATFVPGPSPATGKRFFGSLELRSDDASDPILATCVEFPPETGVLKINGDDPVGGPAYCGTSGPDETRWVGDVKAVLEGGDDTLDFSDLVIRGSNFDIDVDAGSGDDRIIAANRNFGDYRGGPGDDLIRVGEFSGGEMHWISGGDGNDNIAGGNGPDFIVGGEGDDRMRGRGGADQISTPWASTPPPEQLLGNDRIDGGGGEDTLFGGAGRDFVYGRGGDDRISLGSGRDVAKGKEGSDRIAAGPHADHLVGGPGIDVLNGGEQDDVMWGGGDSDWLYGFGGADRLFGEEATDGLIGGEGNDLLRGGAGLDLMHGGPGADRLTQS